MAFAQLGPVGGQEDREVGEQRRLPAERPVDEDVTRRARQPLLGPQYVADLHGVVVDDVGQVVCREAVRLQNDEIVYQGVLERDVAPDEIVEHGRAVAGHREPRDRDGSAPVEPPSLRVAEIAARPIVAGRLLQALLVLPELVKTLRGAEAVVGVVVGQQLLDDLTVSRKPLGLEVRTIRPAHVRALVPVETEPPERVQDLLDRALDRPSLVRVLDADDE